jgi:GTP cyclohydrolase subunit MoaA
MRDSFGREINYLRISVTDRCNLRCVYCMPEEGIPLLSHDDIMSFEQIEAVTEAAVRLGMDKIRLTGGEPLARKGIVELVRMLGRIEGLRTLTMTTNATMLAPLARELASAGLDSVNISLDTLDPERYARITRRGRLADALEGLDAALQAELAVKINMVVLEDTTAADIEEMRRFAASRGAALQTIARYSLHDEKQDGGEYDRPPTCSRCNRIPASGEWRPAVLPAFGHRYTYRFRRDRRKPEKGDPGKTAARHGELHHRRGADRRIKAYRGGCYKWRGRKGGGIQAGPRPCGRSAHHDKEKQAMNEPTSFTHLDSEGNARMVDVSSKPRVQRTATAAGRILLAPWHDRDDPGKPDCQGQCARDCADRGHNGCKTRLRSHPALPYH